jgi:hypothetical protein
MSLSGSAGLLPILFCCLGRDAGSAQDLLSSMAPDSVLAH